MKCDSKQRTWPHLFSHFNIITCNWSAVYDGPTSTPLPWTVAFTTYGRLWCTFAPQIQNANFDVVRSWRRHERNGRCQWITYKTLFDKRCWDEVSYMHSNRSVEYVCAVRRVARHRIEMPVKSGISWQHLDESARTKTTTDFSFIRKYGYLHCPHRTWLHFSWLLVVSDDRELHFTAPHTHSAHFVRIYWMTGWRRALLYSVHLFHAAFCCRLANKQTQCSFSGRHLKLTCAHRKKMIAKFHKNNLTKYSILRFFTVSRKPSAWAVVWSIATCCSLHSCYGFGISFFFTKLLVSGFSAEMKKKIIYSYQRYGICFGPILSTMSCLTDGGISPSTRKHTAERVELNIKANRMCYGRRRFIVPRSLSLHMQVALGD